VEIVEIFKNWHWPKQFLRHHVVFSIVIFTQKQLYISSCSSNGSNLDYSALETSSLLSTDTVG